jgi:hypothetical protein
MPIKFVLRITATVVAFVAILLVLPAAASANSVKKSNAGKLHRLHSASAHVRISRPRIVGGNTLPYGPEYGFLSHVPPNAIRMPGYTFVPGVGILGASCDLPTSACSNQYRDVQ